MKLYNTLTRKIEEIHPLKPPVVTIYTCGPTVYDYPHIGNWFTFVRYDTLVRTIMQSNFAAKWVLNITDVGHLVSDADEGEDKLEKGAKREGKTAWDIAKFYTDYFAQGLKRLNISTPTYMPKATENINEQIALIEKLEEKGFTYQIDDGVYFDTSKFTKYADFAQLDLDEQQAGARVEHNSQKRNATDFALWKLSPKDKQRDMEWESPWGKGFPGWHLECSAMALKYLGETIDIHAGGIDHVPVHHTNEIAQSESATGKLTAQIWMHTNHITLSGAKISKSIGNVINLEDIENQNISLLALRLHILESHYRSQSRFSWESLEAANNRLNTLRDFAVLRFQPINLDRDNSADIAGAGEQILAAMRDDLNTPSALARLSAIQNKLENDLLSQKELKAFEDLLRLLDYLLGLNLADQEDITPGQKNLIAQRQEARANKDWARADMLRDQLLQRGVGVRDTDNGQIWYRAKVQK